MKVLMLADVKKVGKKGEVVEVAPGYAQNFLFAKKLAVAASEKSLEIRQKEIQHEKDIDAQNRVNANKNKEIIEKTTFEFKAKAGSDGRMFGSISTKQVTDEIKKVLNIEVDKRKFVDPIPVNAFGVTLLKIDLYKGIIATVKVHVSASNM